jgi:hypothetical protein
MKEDFFNDFFFAEIFLIFIIGKNWQKSKLNGKSRKTYIKKLPFMHFTVKNWADSGLE